MFVTWLGFLAPRQALLRTSSILLCSIPFNSKTYEKVNFTTKWGNKLWNIPCSSITLNFLFPRKTILHAKTLPLHTVACAEQSAPTPSEQRVCSGKLHIFSFKRYLQIHTAGTYFHAAKLKSTIMNHRMNFLGLCGCVGCGILLHQCRVQTPPRAIILSPWSTIRFNLVRVPYFSFRVLPR